MGLLASTIERLTRRMFGGSMAWRSSCRSGLVKSGVFDAIMFAYNALEVHLLTSPPPPKHKIENLVRNGREMLDLCVEHGVRMLIMKPLAGGWLTRRATLAPRQVLQRALAEVRPGKHSAGDETVCSRCGECG